MTIIDIARIAGVSKSTVSRVISGKGAVSEEKRQRVEAVIRQCGYSPSAAARALSRKNTDLIGLIIPEANTAFFANVLIGVSDVVDKYGYVLLVSNTGNSPDKDLSALQIMKEQKVRGLIYTPAVEYGSKYGSKNGSEYGSKNGNEYGTEDGPDTADIATAAAAELLNTLDCPVVLLERSFPREFLKMAFELDEFYSDNFEGAYAATRALIDAGHSKIGMIAGDQRLSIGRRRLAGFRAALKDAGLYAEELHGEGDYANAGAGNASHFAGAKYILYGNFDEELAYKQIREFLRGGDIPTGFFVSGTPESKGFLRALNDEGLKVPDDIAYIGFEDVSGLNLFERKYSHMNRDAASMGRMAMEMLARRIETRSPEGKKVYMPVTPCLYGSERKIKRRL